MLNSFKRVSLAVALAATTLVASAPAEARGYRDRGGDDAAIAIGAGIIGLAVGAAIASDRGDRYYRDRRYYRANPNYYYYDDYPRYRGHYYRDSRRDYRRDYRRDRNWDRGRYRDSRRHYRY